MAAGTPYLLVVWLASFAEPRRPIWQAAALSSVLIIAGFLLSPPGGEAWKVWLNRGLALGLVWLGAVHLLLWRRAEHMRTLAAIVESSHDAIVALGPRREILAWNRGISKLLGREARDAVGQAFTQPLPGGAEDVMNGTGSSDRGESREAEELVWKRSDGTPVDVSVRFAALASGGGRPVGIAAIARDVSARKRLARSRERLTRELESLNEDLAASNSQLEQFAYVASHDLQAPLRRVSNFVELLKTRAIDPSDEQASLWADRCLAGLEQMRVLVSDLLTFSRVDSQTTPLAPMALGAALAEALERLEADIAEAGAEVAAGTLPEVSGNGQQLVRLFQNLVGNAIKFRGTDPPVVSISAVAREQEWIVSIRDNGVGLDPAKAERIFEMFGRLHTQQEYPGTGLGLAICRRIVQRHGGSLWVESEPGVGSTFSFSLPMTAAGQSEPDTART